MPVVISKLQHKTYETGEFSDERPRSLEETIKLINTFPWEQERHLTDVQPTGPSVTIMNDRGEYLKIGLYFNGKFCVYHRNSKGHLYEAHVPHLADAIEIITDFFNANINIAAFDKKLFSIGSKRHFVTKNFVYKINKYVCWIMMILTGAFSCISFIAILSITSSFFPALISMVVLFSLYQLINHYIYSKKVKLIISKGADKFYFYHKLTKSEFSKKEVAKIILPSMRGTRSRQLSYSTIVFKNKSTLTLSSLVIHPITLSKKFPDILIEHEFHLFPLLHSKSTQLIPN